MMPCSTKTFSSRSWLRRSYSMRWKTSSSLTFHSLTSFQWKNCGRKCRTYLSSCGTSQTTFRPKDCRLGNTSSTSWTLRTATMFHSWSGMLTSNGTQFKLRRMLRRSLKSPKAGFRSSKNNHSFRVSVCEYLTVCEGHKGRTIHLLKQKSKPVPQARKRRKIDRYLRFACGLCSRTRRTKAWRAEARRACSLIQPCGEPIVCWSAGEWAEFLERSFCPYCAWPANLRWHFRQAQVPEEKPK